MIDYASPSPDRDAMLAKVKSELRSEHRRLTDEQIDLIADVAIELRIVRESVWRRVNEARLDMNRSVRPVPDGVDESPRRS